MNAANNTATRAGRYIRQPTGYRAFIPARLPPDPPLDLSGALRERLSEADYALGRNGLPLAVIELKAPGGENATLVGAFNQLQTYKQQIPALFRSNALLVTSDGLCGRASGPSNQGRPRTRLSIVCRVSPTNLPATTRPW